MQDLRTQCSFLPAVYWILSGSCNGLARQPLAGLLVTWVGGCAISEVGPPVPLTSPTVVVQALSHVRLFATP